MRESIGDMENFRQTEDGENEPEIVKGSKMPAMDTPEK
jgi:hypothetical protein